MNDPSNDTRQNGRPRWPIAFAVLLLVLGAGAIAYNIGVTRGLAESGKLVTLAPGVAVATPPATGAVAVPYAVPYYGYYGWHRPWGFGFLAIPLFLIFSCMVARRIFWGGRAHYSGYYGGCSGPESRFDDWHHRAHERMGGTSSHS